jgi:hypothetical protein
MRWFFVALAALLPLSAAAQEPDPAIRDGFVAGAIRQFEAPGVRLMGALALHASVYVYASDDDATAAMPLIIDFMSSEITAYGGTIVPASAPDIGDEAMAFAGDLAQGETTYVAAMLVWRDGRHVSTLYAAGLAGDLFPEMIAVAEAISGRAVADTPDGAWDLLPALGDVPVGFVLKNEEAMTAD